MAEMTVNVLSIELLARQAKIAMGKQEVIPPERPRFTSVQIDVPVTSSGGEPVSEVRRVAIQQARAALEEAIQTLDALDP